MVLLLATVVCAWLWWWGGQDDTLWLVLAASCALLAARYFVPTVGSFVPRLATAPQVLLVGILAIAYWQTGTEGLAIVASALWVCWGTVYWMFLRNAQTVTGSA